ADAVARVEGEADDRAPQLGPQRSHEHGPVLLELEPGARTELDDPGRERVHDVVRVLERDPELAGPDAVRRVRVGRRDDQPAAGPEHCARALEQRLWRREVLEDLARDDDVERTA